jgi:hypothetical protein
MKKLARNRIKSEATDPLARAVEDQLRLIEKDGGEELKVQRGKDLVSLVFGHCEASGETYEIALVRLARYLLDDDQFKTALMHAMRVASPFDTTSHLENIPTRASDRNSTPRRRRPSST